MRRTLPLALALALTAVSPLSGSAAGDVIGGRDASQPYRFMAEVRDVSSDGTMTFRCGGSLVAPRWVLTAGHCVLGGGGVLAPSHFRVALGNAQRSANNQPQNLYGVDRAVQHESYGKPEAFSHDLALLHLTRDATQPEIQIARAEDRTRWEVGKEVRVLGWGSTVPNGGGIFYPDQLQEVDVPVVSDSDCASSYPGAIPDQRFEPSTMFCLGNFYGTEDSCGGDSGGPAVIPVDGGGWRQVGIVSWGGNACAAPTQYGVYTRLGEEPLRSWVGAHIAPPPTRAAAPTKPFTLPKQKSGKKRQCSKQSRRCRCSTKRRPAKKVRRCRAKKRASARATDA